MPVPAGGDHDGGPLSRRGDDLFLTVRLTPRAGRDAVDGPKALSDGRIVLAARVAAVPEDGRANAALLALIAKLAGRPKSTVELVSGATGRVKVVRLAGMDAAAEAALRPALGLA